MPQARQGGNGKASVAIVGSKLEGTGLENEQMGHTQVPTITGKDGVVRAVGRNGLVDRDAGEDADVTLWKCGDCDTDGLVILPKPRFSGFGNKVIFGEDFRNLA